MTTDLVPEVLWSYAPEFHLYEEAGVPEWLDELDLTPAPPYLKMGTRTVDVSDCLRIDRFRDSELALRNRLLDEQRSVVFAARPSADAASAETLDLVEKFLAARGIASTSTPRDMHPLEAAGRLVQEDLCLMMRRDGDWHLDAAVLCFPSLWSLQEKFESSTSGLHRDVAHYADELSPRVDRFFDRLKPGQAVWRRNLSIKAYPLLFLPAAQSLWQRRTHRRRRRRRAVLAAHRTTNASGPSAQREPSSSPSSSNWPPPASYSPDPTGPENLLALYRSLDEGLTTYKTAGNPLSETFLPWLERISA